VPGSTQRNPDLTTNRKAGRTLPLLEEILEEDAIVCDICGGGTIDLVQIGELKVCLGCTSQKKACSE